MRTQSDRGKNSDKFRIIDNLGAKQAFNRSVADKSLSHVSSYDPRRLTGVSVYRELDREFSVGDRIQLTAPDKSLGVANRDLAAIESIAPDGRISARLDNNRQIEFNATEHRHFDHGYAVTSHSSQGLTAERVLVNADSLAELQDSAFDLDQFIRDAFGKRYWRGVTSMISAGSSSGNVQSIVTSATVGATSAAPTAISYGDFVSIYGALDPAYIDNASWVFNSTTRAALMGVVDSLGRPLFQPSPNAGAFDMLLGRPVVLNQYQPSIAATNKAVLFGDFSSGYTFRQVQGDLSILRLNERYADTGEVGFIGYARIGGFSTDAGTHPIVALVQHA